MEILLTSGIELLKALDYPRAKLYFSEMIKLNGNDIEALAFHGLVCFLMGVFSESIKSLGAFAELTDTVYNVERYNHLFQNICVNALKGNSRIADKLIEQALTKCRQENRVCYSAPFRLVTEIEEVYASGYKLSLESIHCGENGYVISYTDGVKESWHQNDAGDSWLIQVWAFSFTHHLGLGQETPEELWKESENWCSVNLKHPVDVRRYKLEFPDRGLPDFGEIETMYFAPKHILNNPSKVEQMGFDYSRWEQIAFNHQPYPEALREIHLQYSIPELREQWQECPWERPKERQMRKLRIIG